MVAVVALLILAGMVGLGLHAVDRAIDRASAVAAGWRAAAKELGLAAAPDLLSGTVEGCAVHVEVVELREGNGPKEASTRITVAPAPRAPRDAGAGEAARSAFLRLRFHGATASHGSIRVEEKGRTDSAAIVSIVRAMLLLCSDEGRATLEAFVAGRASESLRPAAPWQTAPAESAAELAQADALRFLLALHGYDASTE